MQRLASQAWSISLGLLQSARKDFHHVYFQIRRWTWSHFFGSVCLCSRSRGIEKSVEPKDGSTVHLFKGGKMAMENKFGRPYRMREGKMMETTDGKSIAMNGDEVARLSNAMRTHLSR